MMIVKEAEENDLLQLTTIGKRIHDFNNESELSFYYETQAFELYVLEEDKKDIGFACVRFEDDTEAEIDYIAISETEEGKGKATFFLQEILTEMKNSSISKVFLEVRSKNIRAQHLYERNGFVQYRVRKNYYLNDKDDALCYLWEAK